MTSDKTQQDDDQDVVVAGEDTPFEGDPFFELGLAPSIVDDIAGQGLTVPTPIQRDAIPVILEGRDLIGLAQTGTGKTAAYLLPLLHGLLQKRKASTPRRTSILVLVPTRELAYQVSDSIKAFSGSLKVRYLTIVGGERLRPPVPVAEEGRRRACRDPGALRGSDGPRQGRSRRHRAFRPRRGRPDDRSGLPAADPAHFRGAAADQPDGVLLGHDAGRDETPCRDLPERSGDDQGRTRRRNGRCHQPARRAGSQCRQA